jgi:hypothetical protein
MTKREITRDDIMGMDAYGAERKERRAAVTAMKKDRRLHCGPHATFYFENYNTMWHQVHEMLYIERGGEEQIEDELRAYNPLIPQGADLTATVMFEIEDPIVRERFLDGLGGVEETMFIEIDGEKVIGNAEEDVDRTSAEGKASSVQFLHFTFTPEQIAKFKTPNTRILVGMDHPKYALSGDFD